MKPNKASIKPDGIARPPIGWRVELTVVLMRIVHMMREVALPMIKLHLAMKEHVVILSVLLLPLINGVQPQVEAREVFVHVRG